MPASVMTLCSPNTPSPIQPTGPIDWVRLNDSSTAWKSQSVSIIRLWSVSHLAA